MAWMRGGEANKGREAEANERVLGKLEMKKIGVKRSESV